MAEDKNKVGRKWFDLTEEDIKKGKTEESIIAKCKEVWAIDGTDAEAAFYAEVSKYSISRYLEAHPDVNEIRNRLKEKPILKARQAVVKGLDNYANAMDYLKRKRKKEFGDKVELSGDEAHPILVKFINDKDN
jgi:hypothetical protein